jgi:hypothetical protein
MNVFLMEEIGNALKGAFKNILFDTINDNGSLHNLNKLAIRLNRGNNRGYIP